MCVAILGYSLSAVLATFIGSVTLNAMSRDLSIATSHAQYILEDIRNTTFANVATNVTAGNWTWNTAAVTSNGLTAMKSESISTTSSGTTLLDVTVTITWVDTPGRTRTKTLRTLISA